MPWDTGNDPERPPCAVDTMMGVRTGIAIGIAALTLTVALEAQTKPGAPDFLRGTPIEKYVERHLDGNQYVELTFRRDFVVAWDRQTSCDDQREFLASMLAAMTKARKDAYWITMKSHTERTIGKIQQRAFLGGVKYHCGD